MKKFYTLILLMFITLFSFSQEASSNSKQLDEVVVTATRTERKLGNVAVPVSIINQKAIQQAGSVRLKDVLQEHTGLYITSSFGAGVQMQGLSPDYTLIMIDGEPLVGRTAGVLDLNRVTAGNIKKIEIVQGPSSSLYGSEAMAGVINIITDRSFKKQFGTGIRYGFGNPEQGWSLPFGSDAFKNADLTLQGSNTFKKLGVQFFSNASYIDAITYRFNSTDRVPQPVWRLTNQLQLTYPFSNKTKLNFSIRDGYEHIKQEFAVSNNGTVTNSYGREANNDLNINSNVSHRFNSKVKTSLRLYATSYYGSQRLHFKENPDSIYIDEFKQHFYRLEDQTDVNWKKSTLTVGAGYIIDQANSTRYDDFENRKQNTVLYGFTQYEWRPMDKLTIIGGLRYDDNKLFAAAFSPKLAARYAISKKFTVNASIGRGFKAPDFRQLYLNFTNNAAGGYSVFGTIDAVKIINELNSLGQIAELKDDFYKLSDLKPEFSTGINAGGTFIPTNKLSFNFNLFRNDIKNLIDAREVAIRSNGTQIFSYINVQNAYTEGGEVGAGYQLIKTLHVSAGYQLLFTADKDELESIKSGKEFTRDANGYSRLLKRSEYVGLPNRSKHMANLKLTYETAKRFFATSRFIYRSKWAVSNSDGNSVYNTNDEFANGFLLVNISAGKQLRSGIRLQAGMDNVFNYQDVDNLPSLQGRMIYVGAHFDFLTSK
jgi:outer membrane receptor for ferrienterochelin and colicins